MSTSNKTNNSLKNQFYIYSVDGSAFFTDEEHKIQQEIYDLRNLQNESSQEDETENESVNDEIAEPDVDEIKKEIKCKKLELEQKMLVYSGKRTLRQSHIKDKNIISLFESTLSRTLGIEKDTVSKDLIVVETYYYQILEDIIKNGFLLDNENYILFTASAGQIRNKKAVFIKETVWSQHQNTLMCGLTFESINEQGGMNVNKLLAYLALSNSATEKWEGFDINKCIVVDDMELKVNGVVDYIDNKTFNIERKSMDVPINHTDGCGMMLPRVSRKPFMVRLPWVKGLLVPFDFRNEKWIKKGYLHDVDTIKVKDIKGKEWDLIKDDIQIIFTKSQFKMHSYYKDWQEYKDFFIEYNCQAAICNEEEDEIKDSKLNYQMLQTLTDIQNEELKLIASSTNDVIKKIGRDQDTMLKVLGVKKSEGKKNYYQKALSIYPELLMDAYSKDILKETKASIVKQAKAGKLRVEGKYTYIIPDLYAFCEWLLLGVKEPKGILENGQVYCSLYTHEQKLDVLRSPHLYKEHCVRTNVIDDEKRKWFTCKGVYTSIHDLISKVLQFDVDGDKSLVVSDPTVVSVAERNMKGVVPLYYEMSVAKKEQIYPENIYTSLTAAFKANIGEVSNKITKILNSEKEVDWDVIKWLCFINNEIIDYAKTLYKSPKPKLVKKRIAESVRGKAPFFFIYAKEKEYGKRKKKENKEVSDLPADNHEECQINEVRTESKPPLYEKVEPINDSVVNRLNGIIKNKNIHFVELKGKFDFQLLMMNKKIELDENAKPIIERYDKLNRNKKWDLIKARKIDKNLKYDYVFKHIRDELLKINDDVEYVTDVLVKVLHEKRNTPTKETLWKSFGDIMLRNLERNIHGTIQCGDCGKRIKKNNNKQKYCEKCGGNRTKANKEKWNVKNRKEALM